MTFLSATAFFSVNPVSISSVATVLPEHPITEAEVKLYLQKVFSLDESRANVMLSVVRNAQVSRRFCIHPIETIIEPRALSELSREYQRHSIRLGGRAAECALLKARVDPREVDLIITVSCTGFMIPSLDAYLINQMGMRSDIRRLPITELGCAAGAAMLGRARDFLQAYPDSTVLLVSVELPSLTFQRGNTSPANLISSILFGDGAAAAVLTNKASAGPSILASESYLFPNSTTAMGFDLESDGFHIVLSRDVPDMIRDRIKALVDGFLARHGLDRSHVPAFVLHPGGQKLLAFIEEELGLASPATQPSWDVLRECGNLSSASVLFVLERWLEQRPMEPGAYGLLAAFGPGFSAEMSLLQWK
jgi:alkylresorcinol/alkylpyrone synthase